MQYWLMKSEPDVYSIDQLKIDSTTLWTGVRNYLARNHMQSMQVGDQVLFYHSNANPSGVAGIAFISKTAQPDPTQFDKNSDYFDKKAKTEKPIWFCPEVKFQHKFKNFISLPQLKSDKKLSELVLFKSSRLSVQPVSPAHFNHIKKLGG